MSNLCKVVYCLLHPHPDSCSTYTCLLATIDLIKMDSTICMFGIVFWVSTPHKFTCNMCKMKFCVESLTKMPKKSGSHAPGQQFSHMSCTYAQPRHAGHTGWRKSRTAFCQFVVHMYGGKSATAQCAKNHPGRHLWSMLRNWQKTGLTKIDRYDRWHEFFSIMKCFFLSTHYVEQNSESPTS